MLCSILRITVCLYLFETGPFVWPRCPRNSRRSWSPLSTFLAENSTARAQQTVVTFTHVRQLSDTASESAVHVHAQARVKMGASSERGTGWGSGEYVTMACSVFIETVKLCFRVEPAISCPPSVSPRLSASSPPFGTLICACSSAGMIAMVSLVAKDAGRHLGARLSAGIRLLVKGFFFRPLLKSKKLFLLLHIVSFLCSWFIIIFPEGGFVKFSPSVQIVFSFSKWDLSQGQKFYFIFFVYNSSFSVKFKISMPSQRSQKIIVYFFKRKVL